MTEPETETIDESLSLARAIWARLSESVLKSAGVPADDLAGRGVFEIRATIDTWMEEEASVH